MDKAHLKKIIKKGEGISAEFKKSRSKLNKDVFESASDPPEILRLKI